MGMCCICFCELGSVVFGNLIFWIFEGVSGLHFEFLLLLLVEG